MPRTQISSSKWGGLGINYNYNGAGFNLSNDLAYLYNIGFTKIRLLIVEYTLSSTIAQWRSVVQSCLNQGFQEVIYGLSSNPTTITASNWPNFAAALQAEAIWCQGVNDSRLMFCIGNEEENHVDGTTISAATLQSNLIGLQSTIKNLYTKGKVCYTVEASHYGLWQTSKNAGQFTIDKLGLNRYDNDSNFNAALPGFFANFGKGVGFLSEWNSNLGYNDYNDETLYLNDLRLRLGYIKNSGIDTAYLYNYMENTGQWAMRLTNGNFRKAWFDLCENG